MPTSNWTKAIIDTPKRCHQQIRYLAERVRLRSYNGLVRQIAVTGLGRDNPTLFLSNNMKETARELVIRYAARNRIEDGLGISVNFFHLDCLANLEGFLYGSVIGGRSVTIDGRWAIVGTSLMDDESREMHRLQPRSDDGAISSALPTAMEQARSRTPARILIGRAGGAYRTAIWLELRCDHAAAKDAVFAKLDLARDLGEAFVVEWGLFEVATLAQTKNKFLLRPDLGRTLCVTARVELASRCPAGVDFQVAISDGLSAMAVQAQVPTLLPLLAAQAHRRGWRFGQPFVIRHGRVGVLNEIGEVLDPADTVLLIGERPGLATDESLSAYMAYRPRAGHDDVSRNLISNIHARGVAFDQTADRIARLAAQMIQLETSGIAVKEQGIAPVTLAPGTPQGTSLGA